MLNQNIKKQDIKKELEDKEQELNEAEQEEVSGGASEIPPEYTKKLWD